MKKGKCMKCDGAGYIPALQHIENGICYTCRGEGEVIEKEEKIHKKAKLTKAQKDENERRSKAVHESTLNLIRDKDSIVRGFSYYKTLKEGEKKAVLKGLTGGRIGEGNVFDLIKGGYGDSNFTPNDFSYENVRYFIGTLQGIPEKYNGIFSKEEKIKNLSEWTKGVWREFKKNATPEFA